MKTIAMFKITNSEKNRLWYPNLVGRLLNDIQFDAILFNYFIDFERVEYKVRDVTND